MTGYTQPLDIANRALQFLKKPRITAFTNNIPGANELNFAYDKVRKFELSRNLWTFATRTCILRPIDNTTLYIHPTLWNTTTFYETGAIVSYPTGTHWIANLPNSGMVPSNTTFDNAGHLIWDSYFGPLTAQQWQNPLNTTVVGANNGNLTGQQTARMQFSGYSAGELAFLVNGLNKYTVYQCVHDTSDPPTTADIWKTNHFYNKNQVITSTITGAFTVGSSDPDDGSLLGGTQYMSTMDVNVGNDPTLTSVEAPQPTWSATVQYAITDYVIGSDGQIYLAIATPLLGYNPVTDYLLQYWQPTGNFAGAWTTNIPATIAPNKSWQVVAASLAPIVIAWPAGAGPAEDTFTTNIFRKPSNWLKLAPDEPKTGIIPWLGGPKFIPQRDWVFEGEFLLSVEVRPLKVRFVADVQDVTRFHAMFCEAIAVSMAISCRNACDSEVPLAELLSEYRRIVQDARTQNAIEMGPVVPPDDEWISVRY